MVRKRFLARKNNFFKKCTDDRVKSQAPLLEINNLSLDFRQYKLGLHEVEQRVIQDMNITINAGEIVAVVGASGSGKSLLAHAIIGLLPENAILEGDISYKGITLTAKRQMKLRGNEISLIPQSVNALNPFIKIGEQIHPSIKGKEKNGCIQEVFQKLGLSHDVIHQYPFELSGGMARRVLVTTALLSGAKLIIADEPTPGLDPKVLDVILKTFKQLSKTGKGIMFITHDLHHAVKVADKIAVVFEGQTIEVTSAHHFSREGNNLKHPYTKALWNALPQNNFTPLMVSQLNKTDGCMFRHLCVNATEICKSHQPELRITDDTIVRCHHA